MKNLNYLLVLFIILIITLSDLVKASVPEGISLTKTSGGYGIDFTLPEYELLNINAEGTGYTQINIRGYGVIPDAGLPALPIISFNLFVSDQELQPGFEVKNIIDEEKIMKSKIYPFQMPWEKSNPIEERPFTINNDYYNSTGNIDQPFVKISEPFIIAGVKGVTVTLYPFRYNPKEDKLYVTSTGSVDILITRIP